MKYLKRNEINNKKWDVCVENSSKPLIYGLSWYLDAAANKKWDALIWGDYETVLPLPWNRKLILKQLYQPHTVQQLGIFSTYKNDYQVDKIIEIINKKFIQAEYTFANNVDSSHFQKKLNLVLPLTKKYEEIYANFSKNRKYDARNLNFEVKESTDLSAFFKFYKRSSRKLIQEQNIDAESYQRVITGTMEKKRGFVRYVAIEGELVSAIFCTEFKKRITLLISTTTEKGYNIGANIFLIDQLIRQYSNHENYVLDFEGSEIPGVKSFYESFGAQPEYYYLYKKQNPVIKCIKKYLR